MKFEDYITTLVDFLELLPESMVIERISGEAPGDYFIGPQWCLDKPAILKGIEAEFVRRDSWQGKKCEGRQRGQVLPIDASAV